MRFVGIFLSFVAYSDTKDERRTRIEQTGNFDFIVKRVVMFGWLRSENNR